METIASLKPDLIIADKDRHAAAYDELSKIAPVLLLNSRYGSFDDILAQAQVIGDTVGKHDAMKAKVDALVKEFDDIKAHIPAGRPLSSVHRARIRLTCSPRIILPVG